MYITNETTAPIIELCIRRISYIPLIVEIKGEWGGGNESDRNDKRLVASDWRLVFKTILQSYTHLRGRESP